MKHLKLFFALFAMLALGVTNAWGADSGLTASDGVFVIDFYNSDKLTSTSGTNLNTSNYSSFVKVADGLNAKDVVTSVSLSGTVQYNKNGGLTVGSSSANSHYVTFSIGTDYAVKKVMVYATKYETGRFLLNGKAADSGELGAKNAQFSAVTKPLVWDNLDGVTTLKFTKDNGSGSNQKRLTIYTIVCEYETSSSGGDEPVASLSATPTTIDFGTVYQGADVESKTVAVNFENLTGNVTYSGLSTPFTATGTISNDGDKITIAANTTTIGDYTQTLTIASTADSKTAEVTVKMNVEAPFNGKKLGFDFVNHPTGWPVKSNATAGEYVYNLDDTDYTFKHSKSGDGVYVAGTSGTSGYLLIASGNTLGLPAIKGHKLVKVQGTLNNSGSPSTSASVSITDGTNTLSGGTALTWNTKGGIYTYSLSGTQANTMYYLSVSNKNLQMITLVLYYEECEKYALTITEPAVGTGTLLVKDGENVLTSGVEIYEGTKLTIIATPETGYEDGVVVVKNASDEDITTTVYADGVLTMPAYAVTISATFEKKPCELLAKPTVSATTTYSSATLTWEAVANAAKYSVKVGTADAVETTETSYEVTGLNAETEYTYQVQAIAEADQDTYCDSEVAEGKFTTAAAPVATLTLSDIEGTTTKTGALNGTITLPTTAAECSKTFVGWDADENCNHAPTYAKGAEYTLAAETQTLYAVYADGEAGETVNVFSETFDACEGKGANGDEAWSGTGIAAATLTLEGWTFEKGNAANGCAKFGTSSVKGSAETPAIALTGNAILTFRAGAWNGSSEKTTLNISAIGATLDMSSVTLKKAEWTTYTVAITNASGSVNVKFEAANASNNRFFLDDVVVSQASVNYSNYSTTCAAAPTAEVDPTSVTATAAGGNGKVEVTYENVNTEDLRVALFNDEECGVVFTAGWLTASIDADKNITYTVAENTTYAERNAYIQLTAPDAAAATDPAVVVIPVTQAAKEKVFASLAELVAADLTAGDEVTVTLNNDVIKDFYLYNSKRAGVVFDVQKDGKDIKIYFNNQTTIVDWAVGGKLSGTLTNVKWTTYSSAWQLAPDYNTWAWANLTYTEPKAVSTVVVSGAPTKTTYVDGEAFDPAGLTVTVNYNDATTEVNPTGVTFTVTPTTLVKGQTSVSVTATFNSVTSAAYEVTNLTVNDIPTKTVAEFIAAGGTRCYLEGIVSDIDNTTYGNFNLTDASGTIYVYGCLNASGEAQKFAQLGVKEGDKIKVIADEFTIFNNNDQATDVQYVSHKSAATIEVADIAMEVGKKQTISATVTPEGAPVTYAIKAGSDNCITLNGAEISATAAGTAIIVATIAETPDYMGATKEITVTVTAVDTRKKAVSPSPFTATSGELNPNDITYTSSKGGGTGDPNIKNNYIQLYQIASGKSYGGYITFNAVKGCKIDQVMIVTGNTTTTHIAYSVNDVMSPTTENVAKNAEYHTEAGLDAESVNIYCMHTNSDNRLFIASAIVYYTGQPLADPELSWTSNAVELRVGEAFTAPTLNNPYNVTGITYSSDDESLAKVNATTGAVTLVPDATGTATIIATFDGNDTYKAAEVSYTITVKPALVYGVWELVTDATSLAAGDKVVVVAKDYDFALSTNQGNNNRGQAAVTKNNNTISFSADVQVLTLETGTEENTFALNTGNGYLYAVSSSSNHLKTQSNKDANASWKITITDGTASIVAQGDKTRNIMQYNQSSSLFACYGSASQKALCLYTKKNVKVEGETNNSDIPNQSDVTVDNAELTVTTEAEYDNMYIGNNGSVDVEETVTVNNLYIQTTMGTTTSGQLNTTPENIIIKGDVYIDITLGDDANPQKWHAFTVPFPVDAMNGIFDLNDNKLTNGVNYAIMQYHGDVRAQGKYGWKKYSGVLVPGTFYLMTVDGARTTYRFKKVKDAALVAENTKSLSAYTGGGKNTDHGWNGVGNPTLMHGKVAINAQILDPVSYTYKVITASSAHFTVGTPFFIQATVDGEVAITAEGNSSLAPARRAATAVKNIKVMLGNSDYTDYLYVSASEDATNEYEIGKDLAKMTMTSTPIVPQIFAQAYGTYLCMVNAPMISNEATVALNLYAPAEGEYTLSVEEQADATVYLLYNGNIVWNLSMSEYPIHLSQGDNAGYSLVVRRENAPTDVENIFGADEQTEKFIYNGNLYILHEGKVFDAVGNVLK